MEEKELPPKENDQQESQPEAGQPSGSPTVEELTAKAAEAEKQVETYKDLLLRKAADFENFKKRIEGEASAFARFAKVELITDLLPIVDDFERSLKQNKDRRESEAFTKGIELIYQKLLKFLDSQSLKAMETVGKEFDVHYHDALLQVPRSDVPPHIVVEEVEKGYMLDDRVIRHAKVIVSTSPPGDGTAEQPAAEPTMNAAPEKSPDQVTQVDRCK